MAGGLRRPARGDAGPVPTITMADLLKIFILLSYGYSCQESLRRTGKSPAKKQPSDLKGTRQFLTILNFWVFENQVMEGTPSYQRQFILREGHFSERALHPAV
jgi:hypothetical protein